MDAGRHFYDLWLSALPGLGAGGCRRLIRAASSGTAAEIFGMSRAERLRLAVRAAGSEEAGEKLCGIIDKGRKTACERAAASIRAMHEKGIGYVRIGEKGYPERLLQIFDPPYGLYFLGRLPSDTEPAVSVIGARNGTPYGLYQAARFAGAFARAGVTVVSGMARGIDSAAQSEAVRSGGRSIAVLGSGVDVCYPAGSRDLYKALLAHGTVFSEYPPGTPPDRRYFPARNRLISGLGDILLVVEAGKKSGTMITVSDALEQGKDIFAVPGRCGDVLSEGCNRLILDGAGIAISPEHILTVMAVKGGRDGSCDPEGSDGRAEEERREQERILWERTVAASVPEEEGREICLQLFGILSVQEAKTADRIMAELKRDCGITAGAGEMAFRLMRLQAMGLVRESAPGCYLRSALR